MDANFRLCRKSKAAKVVSQYPPLLNGYFLEQSKVDNYISIHSYQQDTSVSVSIYGIVEPLVLLINRKIHVVSFVLVMHCVRGPGIVH